MSSNRTYSLCSKAKVGFDTIDKGESQTSTEYTPYTEAQPRGLPEPKTPFSVTQHSYRDALTAQSPSPTHEANDPASDAEAINNNKSIDINREIQEESGDDLNSWVNNNPQVEDRTIR